MRIITPTEIEQVAWEGYLEPLGGVKSGGELPLVTLGKPMWWSAEAAMEGETGKQWTPPAGNARYTLVRLACTLHEPDDHRTRYTEATLTTYLRPRQGSSVVVAADLFPQQLTAESKGTRTVMLDPRLKFAKTLDVSLLKVGTEIEYHQTFPVIQGYGLGESVPYWSFKQHAKTPLLGCQSVYMVLEAPQEADGVRLSVELVATLKTPYGWLRGSLPTEAQAHLSCMIR